MTEMSMSVAEPPPGAAAPGKNDPVVPDAVVYVCSVVIVIMVVGGVIGLSILMKQRLDVNQNVTTAAPAGPGAPPPKARLVSVEDSESNDFKVFNDDDPFHYRVAKARDGYHRKVPFYEAAHSKQKAKRHKKAPTTRTTRVKKKTTKRVRATTKNRGRRLPVTLGAKTTAKHGKRKANVAHNRDLEKDKTVKATSAATLIREIGAVENMSDVGVAGIEIKAKKNAAKNARKDAVDGDVDKGDIQVSAKKKVVAAKEKKRQAVVETMKVFLKSPSEVQPPNITINKSPLAPGSVNLSDVSASEGASGDAGGAEHRAVSIKLIKPAEIEKPSEIGKAASHNQSAPVAVSGSSVNGTASNASSLGNARVGNASSDKAAPVNSLPGNTSHGNTSVKNKALTNSSSSANKNSASRASGAKEDSPADSPAAKKSASPVDESPAVGSPSGSKSPADVAGGNKLPEAKQPASSGSATKDATGMVNQSVHQGSRTNNARPLDASAASEKSADKVPPVNGPPAGAPSGAEKSAAAQSAEESGDAGSAANNKGADSLAPGPSAQRPLFCDVRKSILRPLASYCTHILFGRLSLKESNGVVTVRDFDSATQEQLHLASVLRPGWPHVSLMATLGGGGEDDVAMAKAFEAGVATLDAMATEAANLVRKRGLDGINVHWTVPDLEADVEAYAVGLVDFIKKLRKELGPSSIITIVLPNETEERNAAFNVQELQPLVNYLFVSTHDTFSPNSALTHFNGPAQDIDTGGMFTAIADVINQLSGNQSRKLCFTFGLSGVAYKVGAGAPLAKYVPLVGAADPSGAQSAPNAGQLPKEGRPITYDEVCKLNLTCHQAHVEKSCYDKVGDTWYGYVDEKAVASKAKWILKDGWENLCVVAWNVDADDVKGSCRGDASASYPLLRSLSQATAALAY